MRAGADDEDVSPAGHPHVLLHRQHGLDGQHPQVQHAGLLPAPQAVCNTSHRKPKYMFAWILMDFIGGNANGHREENTTLAVAIFQLRTLTVSVNNTGSVGSGNVKAIRKCQRIVYDFLTLLFLTRQGQGRAIQRF